MHGKMYFTTRNVLMAGMLTVASLYSQTLSFDAASIKPAAPMEAGRVMVGMRGGPGTPDPGHVRFTNVSINNLVQTAYDVRDYQVSGPGWLESVRFDVECTLPATSTKEQYRTMLQNLLADRFKLVLHRTSKEEPIYALVVAKNGPKLKPASDDPKQENAPAPLKDGMPPPGRGGKGSMMMMAAPGGRMRLVANGAKMANLVLLLAGQVDRPVVDMTGLTGEYDITLEFAQDMAAMQSKMAAMGAAPPPSGGDGGGPVSASQDPNGPASIYTALTDQLGLRLDPRKGPVDHLIIDSVQKTPTDN